MDKRNRIAGARRKEERQVLMNFLNAKASADSSEKIQFIEDLEERREPAPVISLRTQKLKAVYKSDAVKEKNKWRF